MPYIKIETNKPIAPADITGLLAKTTAFFAETLAKPEQYIMLTIDHSRPMRFNGSSDPAAYVELKSISLSAERCPDLSAAVCTYLQTALELPPDRVYIEFTAINGSMFGWNSATF